ncbi:DUF4123 domain-containing protein [Nannocystis radixulma]|uniref:DUF4123 domain-containing protein n=1 Tax=Nannocystis radixulma TaxID=2995305 RepID=A0ABT5BKP7_9BACT|nr:DUF4123 domain-containing protein [Nannocystis radixulma]MDC0674170.1 DUF4123 domain-containing protein [Nannocystis radixulma]
MMATDRATLVQDGPPRLDEADGPRLVVEVLWGPEQGRKAVLEPGGVITVGSGERAGLRLAHDEALAPIHFSLVWDGEVATLRAAVTDPTCLDGQPVREGRSGHGGWIRAGASDLALAIERHTAPETPPTPETVAAAAPAIAALRGQPGRLFAVVDASRDERVGVLLRESPARHRSLFDGWQGDALAEGAPYLVELGAAPHPELVDDLVLEGWHTEAERRDGDGGWAIFLSAPDGREFEAVRRHLRKFLMVELGREKVYFRFYDPRVLRTFVPTCTPTERREFLADLAWHITCPRGLLTFRT